MRDKPSRSAFQCVAFRTMFPTVQKASDGAVVSTSVVRKVTDSGTDTAAQVVALCEVSSVPSPTPDRPARDRFAPSAAPPRRGRDRPRAAARRAHR